MNVRVSQRRLRAGLSALTAFCLLSGFPDVGRSEPGEDAAPAAVSKPSAARSAARSGGPVAVLAQSFSDAEADGPSIAKFSAQRPAQVRALLLANTRAGQEAAQAASALVPFLPSAAFEIEQKAEVQPAAEIEFQDESRRDANSDIATQAAASPGSAAAALVPFLPAPSRDIRSALEFETERTAAATTPTEAVQTGNPEADQFESQGFQAEDSATENVVAADAEVAPAAMPTPPGIETAAALPPAAAVAAPSADRVREAARRNAPTPQDETEVRVAEASPAPTTQADVSVAPPPAASAIASPVAASANTAPLLAAAAPLTTESGSAEPSPTAISTAPPAAAAAPAAAPTTLGREISALAPPDAEATSALDSQPRRRTAFQSAMQRAAANSALALRGAAPESGSYQGATNQQRFSPRDPRSGVDPFGEGMQQAADAISLVPGLAISSASVFAGYSSNAIPTRGLSNGLGGSLGSDYDYGGTASITYSNRGRGSSLLVNYTPSHTQRVNLDQWSTTNHSLTVSTSKDVGARWSLRGTGNAGYMGLEQFWLELPLVHFPTDVPDTLEGLYDAVEQGRFTDEEFAAILTGSPVVDDPGGRQLDLGRVLSYSGSASASYAYSPRWTFGFSGNLQRSQLRGADRPDRPTIGGFYLADNSSLAGAGSMSYRLSPRTSIGLTNSTTSTRSEFADGVSNNTMASVSQRLNRSLRYQVGLGIGAVSFSRTVVAVNPEETSAYSWTANGGLDYTMGNHVFSVAGSRRVGDTFGLGANTTTEGSAGWQWVSVRSPWAASASIRVLHLNRAGGAQFTGFALNSNLYSLGLSRQLSPTTLMRTDYYHGRYVSPFDGLFANAQIHRMQVSLIWRPAERR